MYTSPKNNSSKRSSFYVSLLETKYQSSAISLEQIKNEKKRWALKRSFFLLDPRNRYLMYCTLASKEQNVNLLWLQLLELCDTGIEFPSLEHLKGAHWVMLIWQYGRSCYNKVVFDPSYFFPKEYFGMGRFFGMLRINNKLKIKFPALKLKKC